MNPETGQWEPTQIYDPKFPQNDNKNKPGSYITAFDIIFVDKAMYDFKQSSIQYRILAAAHACNCFSLTYVRSAFNGKPAPFAWKEYPYQIQIMSIKTGSQTNGLLMFFDAFLLFLFPYQQTVEYQVVARLYSPKGEFLAAFQTDKIKRDYSIWLLNIFTNKKTVRSGYDHKFPEKMQFLEIMQKVSDRIQKEQPDKMETQSET